MLFHLKDRRERDFVLGPTHEEVVVDLFKKQVQSYRDMPLMVYQIQTKFRDEARPRGGLMRVREFTMKDAYSFDADWEALDASYDAAREAYVRIFERCGVPTIPVQADSGAIGGKDSEEFMFLTDVGEDTDPAAATTATTPRTTRRPDHKKRGAAARGAAAARRGRRRPARRRSRTWWSSSACRTTRR